MERHETCRRSTPDPPPRRRARRETALFSFSAARPSGSARPSPASGEMNGLLHENGVPFARSNVGWGSRRRWTTGKPQKKSPLSGRGQKKGRMAREVFYGGNRFAGTQGDDSSLAWRRFTGRGTFGEMRKVRSRGRGGKRRSRQAVSSMSALETLTPEGQRESSGPASTWIRGGTASTATSSRTSTLLEEKRIPLEAPRFTVDAAQFLARVVTRSCALAGLRDRSGAPTAKTWRAGRRTAWTRTLWPARVGSKTTLGALHRRLGVRRGCSRWTRELPARHDSNA